MHRYPVDSTEARELREQAAEDDATAHTAPPEPEHDPRCRAGWLGEDAHDRPIPCLTCRPHLAPRHRRHLIPA